MVINSSNNKISRRYTNQRGAAIAEYVMLCVTACTVLFSVPFPTTTFDQISSALNGGSGNFGDGGGRTIGTGGGRSMGGGTGTINPDGSRTPPGRCAGRPACDTGGSGR